MGYRAKLKKIASHVAVFWLIMILGGCTEPKLSQAVATVDPGTLSPGKFSNDEYKTLYSSTRAGVGTSESPGRAPGLRG